MSCVTLRASPAAVAGRRASLLSALTLFSAVCCVQLDRDRTDSDPPAFPFFQGSSVWAVSHAHASYVHATKHLAVVPIRGSGPNKVKDGPWPGGRRGGSPLVFSLFPLLRPLFSS